VKERTEAWELTANQYLALPQISRADASLHSVNVLLRSALGLVEWCGDPRTGTPLLAPVLHVDGEPQALTDLIWERVERWVPRATVRLPGELTVQITICAPTGYDAGRRGAFFRFDLENRGPASRLLEVEIRGEWSESNQVSAARRPAAAQRRMVIGVANPGIALELAGSFQAALGLVAAGADIEYSINADGSSDARDAGATHALGERETGRFSARRRLDLAPGRRRSATFYLGVAAEREGALATAAALRRQGAEALLKETRLELSRLSRKTRDAALGSILNRNLIFAYFFGVARGLDDDRLYSITSRSPLHPRCGTFNERDALLWAFPALLLADPPLARELILRCFEQYSHRPGEAVRYVDGGVLAPGFALDQWCGYILAVAAYVESTGDVTLIEEPMINELMRELEAGIYTKLHPEVFLAATELLPSGGSAEQPFVTYDNALLHAAFAALARLRGEASEEGKRSAAAADEIAAAVWRRCMADVDGLPVLAFSTDLAESASIYDDPAGSLQLLPHFRFCENTEPVWRNTVEFLRSPRYQLWLGNRNSPGLASRSAPSMACLSALCADLLGTRKAEALDTLRHLEWPAGVAAYGYDPDSGQAVGAPHDAALAGLLVWSLQHALHS
jgi:hypothetical protein